MSSPASFKGHPLHPILVALPIGLWIFSLVSDVIFKMGWGVQSGMTSHFIRSVAERLAHLSRRFLASSISPALRARRRNRSRFGT